MAEIDVQAIVDQVSSHAMRTGYFERTAGHEPRNAPGAGLTHAVWVERLTGTARMSGMDVTSALLVLNVRLYSSAELEPLDLIDPAITRASAALIAAYHGDFEITAGEYGAMIPLLGTWGAPQLAAVAGYLQAADRLMRVMTITLPIVIKDCWTQAG